MKNWIYLFVSVVVRFYMFGALAISFTHVISASHKLGLYGWQAWTVPFAVDGMAILGMIGRCARFDESTQRTGLKLQIGAGLVSLAANVYAGNTRGEQLYGILIVALFVIAEWYGGKLRPAATAAQLRGRKAAATRKANAAAKVPAVAKTRKPATKKRPTLAPVPAAA